jgi:hypothetical protein
MGGGKHESFEQLFTAQHDTEIVGRATPHGSLAKRMETMKQWLEEDILITKTAISARTTPARLLDLRKITVRLTKKTYVLEGNVYLRESRRGDIEKGTSALDLAADERYIALSYRWPPDRSMTTSVGNYSTFVQSFPLTFQDTIFVAKQLGVENLWIDALCIIQDTPADWNAEAVKMGDIYAGAVCTVAVHTPWSSRASTGYLLYPTPKGRKSKYTGEDLMRDFEAFVDRGSLSQRGWILQERVLSTRLIHFVHGRAFWESRRTGSFEYSGVVVGWVLRQRVLDASVCAFTQYWFDLVERFSKCELTVEGDKLFAMQGIATHVRERVGIDYSQGLWENSVHCGLLWIAEKGKLRRPREERASSWSWACRDGAVTMPWKFAYGRLPVSWEERCIVRVGCRN